jgi:hypothetical protein
MMESLCFTLWWIKRMNASYCKNAVLCALSDQLKKVMVAYYMSLHKLVQQKFKTMRNAVEDDGSHLKPINISFEGALTTMYFNGPEQDHYLPLNRYHCCRAPSIYGLKKIMSM